MIAAAAVLARENDSSRATGERRERHARIVETACAVNRLPACLTGRLLAGSTIPHWTVAVFFPKFIVTTIAPAAAAESARHCLSWIFTGRRRRTEDAMRFVRRRRRKRRESGTCLALGWDGMNYSPSNFVGPLYYLPSEEMGREAKEVKYSDWISCVALKESEGRQVYSRVGAGNDGEDGKHENKRGDEREPPN